MGFSVLLTSPNPKLRFRNEDAKGIGHTVTCELKTGEMYRGHLMNCEAGDPMAGPAREVADSLGLGVFMVSEAFMNLVKPKVLKLLLKHSLSGI